MAATVLASCTADVPAGGIFGSYNHYTQFVVGAAALTNVASIKARVAGPGTAGGGVKYGIASAVGATTANTAWVGAEPANTPTTGWTTDQVVDFPLPAPVTLSAGGTYYLVAHGTGGDGGNQIKVQGPGAKTLTGLASIALATGGSGATTASANMSTSSFPNWFPPYVQLMSPAGPLNPTLAAVPDPVAGVVNLTVTNATGAMYVTRYVSGQPGVRVRGSFANGRTVPDPDAPLNVDIVYIATDTAGQSPQVTVRLESGDAFLTVMSNPALLAKVTVLADDSQAYEGLSTAHKILASNIPLVTVEPPALRSGTYRLLLPSLADWLALRAILMTDGVMLLRSPCQTEYLDTSFIMTAGRTDIRWSSQPPRVRVFELDYQATAPDATPPTDIAWSWADVPGEFATWADVPLTVPTWADMVTYDPSGP